MLAAGAFAAVWLVSHAVNVLVLLSPVALVGTALKLAQAHPPGPSHAVRRPQSHAGAACMRGYLALAWGSPGGASGCWCLAGILPDLLLPRWRRQRVEGPAVRAFAAELEGVPARTYGTLTRTEAGAVDFTFRPGWCCPRGRSRVADSVACVEVERGLLGPEVVRVAAHPPRHSPSSATPALPQPRGRRRRAFGALPVREAAVVRGLVTTWRWLTAQLGRRHPSEVVAGEPAPVGARGHGAGPEALPRWPTRAATHLPRGTSTTEAAWWRGCGTSTRPRSLMAGRSHESPSAVGLESGICGMVTLVRWAHTSGKRTSVARKSLP